MALPVTAKAQEIARQLQSNLAVRFGAMATPLTVVPSLDSNSYPVLTISDGSAATNEATIVIRVSPFDNGVGTDVLGLRVNQYANHVIEMVTETAATSLTFDHLAQCWIEVFAQNCQTKIYQRANGAAPTTADMTAGNLKSTLNGRNVYWGQLATS